MVKTDNYIETYVQLPDKVGAWPALFTWNPIENTDISNEVDVFEYHPESGSSNTLELTSHLQRPVGEEACFFKRPNWIYPRAWVKIGTNLGKDTITW